MKTRILHLMKEEGVSMVCVKTHIDSELSTTHERGKSGHQNIYAEWEQNRDLKRERWTPTL